MNSAPVRLRTRSDDAVQKLRTGITHGELPPGTLLAEAAVARQLGVSRVPVREALFTLEREGLVEFSATGRAYVKALQPHDFEELYQLRLSLEPMAARLAAPRLQRDTRALEQNIAETARARTPQELTHLDLNFHELIIEASQQTRLIRFWKSLRSEMELWLGRLQREHQIKSKSTRETTVLSHTQLVRVFQTQSPAAAERLNREHIQGWRDFLPVASSAGEN
ncbi:MAG TPA: GntR family transcriptional regulator [Planctomycetota bacterium]|nr:GntR family transcriptional regulator [Planctomycetota bacterium]